MIKKKILIFLTCNMFFLLFQNCKPQNTSQENIIKEIIKTKKTDSITTNSNSEKINKELINIEKIDSIQFFLEKDKTTYTEAEIIKLTDITEVKKLLNGVIDFNEVGDETIVQNGIKKIKFRNGKIIANNEGLINDCAFIAYFPNEDIILLRNPAEGDESLNLKNGKGTLETGNPDLINYSPKKTYRLNGYTNGQGMCNYFFQKKINKEYEVITSLSDEVERLKNHWIFHIAESFWFNENIIYLKETSMGEGNHYFKIEIIE